MMKRSDTGGPTILVVEDEEDILHVLEYNLQRAGYTVMSAADGRAGLELARAHTPDLLVLDLMLPALDGLEICRALRAEARTEHIPIIMLTARGEENDIVAGLAAGADDYVAKPFSPRELVARVHAMLRRSRGADSRDAGHAASGADPSGQRVERAGVTVDLDRHSVSIDGVACRFTRTELRLLHALITEPGRVFTRDQLVESVMGSNAWITERTIDVHVRGIRKKLGARADVLETVRGVGYRFADGRT